jgi:hypothetical protein
VRQAVDDLPHARLADFLLAVEPALRKYFETTMSVASCDHVAGISAPCILKTTEPSGFVMMLLRRSQTTESNGSLPTSV